MYNHGAKSASGETKKNQKNFNRITTTTNKHESGISEDSTTSVWFQVAIVSLTSATGKPARKACILNDE
jgi:hypothetical protein